MTTDSTPADPSAADRQIVVIGAGLAAAHVVGTLRDGGFAGPLTVVGDEGELPYERPPLSKEVLTGAKPASSAFVHDADWYAQRDITLYLDDAARAIDREQRRVTLTSGATLDYTDLVLATGASARRLPIDGVDLDGVHTLRTMADSAALREAFASAERLVVVGAGWIGLEAAAAARQAEVPVTVLEYADVPLKAALGPTLGAHFRQLHEDHGVTLVTGVPVESIEGSDGHVTGVRAGGTLHPADLVVVGVGASPNTQLAEAAGLEVDDGVLVDEHLRSSDPHVLAVGDVASARSSVTGERLRVEHWDHAIRQGKLAGRVLLGDDAGYDWVPYFFTDQYDLGMEYVGHGGADDEVVIRGDRGSGEFIAFWVRDGAVTAAMNVNFWDVNDDLRALIGTRVDPQRLADADVALADLAAG